MNTSALRLALLLALVVTAIASALALRTPRLWNPLESAAPEWRGPTAPLAPGFSQVAAPRTVTRPLKATPVAVLCPRGTVSTAVETTRGVQVC
ncbi:MAG: hypothetical protein RJA44_346 [Pseudomonadota bacterium]|jgi:hypothetical protein